MPRADHRLLFLSCLSVCLALGACASSPDPVTAGNAAAADDCIQREPAIGSLIVRRESCVPSTEESRAEARRRVEALRDAQDRARNSQKTGTMGGG